MVATNGNNYSFIDVCRCRSKTYRNDIYAINLKMLGEKRISTRHSNATYMCSKVKAELDADNKILRIEKLK